MALPLTERLNNLSYTGAIGLAMILGGLYFFMYYDDGSSIVAAATNIDSDIQLEEARKRETEKTLQEAEVVKAEVSTLADKFKVASAKLPSELRTQQLVDMIRTLVQNSGCRLVNIKPLAIEKRQLYDEYPISVEIRGTYSNISVFLFYIATVERITRIKDFTITNVDDYAPGGVIRLEGNIVSFRFRAESAGLTSPSDSLPPGGGAGGT